MNLESFFSFMFVIIVCTMITLDGMWGVVILSCLASARTRHSDACPSRVSGALHMG